MRILLWLTIPVVLLLSSTAKTDPQIALSEHAKEIIIRGAGTLDSLIVLWSDTSGTGSQILYEKRFDVVIEIVREKSVLTIPHPFAYSKDYSSLVIQQVLESMYGPWEGNNSQLSATATFVDMKGAVRDQWSITEDADEAEHVGDFYVTTEYGCCDERALHRAHSLSNGKTVIPYQSELYSFDSSEGSRSSGVDRYIAIHSPGVREREFVGMDSNFVAFVYYATGDSLLHVARIEHTGPPLTEAIGEPYFWQWSVGMIASSSIDSLRRVCPNLCISFSDQKRLTAVTERCLILSVTDDLPKFVIGIQDDDFVIEPLAGPGFQIVKVR
jgi:hypothetical protein